MHAYVTISSLTLILAFITTVLCFIASSYLQSERSKAPSVLSAAMQSSIQYFAWAGILSIIALILAIIFLILCVGLRDRHEAPSRGMITVGVITFIVLIIAGILAALGAAQTKQLKDISKTTNMAYQISIAASVLLLVGAVIMGLAFIIKVSAKHDHEHHGLVSDLKAQGRKLHERAHEMGQRLYREVSPSRSLRSATPSRGLARSRLVEP